MSDRRPAVTAEELRQVLVGNVGALVTPLVAGDGATFEVDTDGLERLVAVQEGSESSAVVVLGTTGEGHVLARSAAATVLDRAVQAASVPVICGVTGTSTADALNMCRWAHEHGASAVLVTPPTYYRLGAATVEAFFAAVMDKSPVPVLIDHMPGLAKVALAPSALARLADHANAAAVVDGSEDIGAIAELIRTRRVATPVLIARAPLLLPGLAVGAHGLLSPAGGCAPGVVAALLRRWSEGDVAAAREAQAELSALSFVLHTTRVPVSVNVKVLLAHAGLLAAAVSPAPFGDLTEAERAELVSTAMEADALRTLARHIDGDMPNGKATPRASERDDVYAETSPGAR